MIFFPKNKYLNDFFSTNKKCFAMNLFLTDATFVAILLSLFFSCNRNVSSQNGTNELIAGVNQNVLINAELSTSQRKFEIDYENDTFVKDGQPFRYVSGSFHYFRTPRYYWQDRLRKIRAAGLNAVSTYVEWSFHEPSPGQFQFTGDADLEYFLELAYQEDLLVLFRPGPYICAERDFGGLPYWLLNIKPNISLRSSDEVYQHYVNKWFAQLFPRITRFLYGNGGPIILVQVENEAGSYTCDKNHMIWLRDQIKYYVRDNAVLYTTDGAGTGFLKCTVPGVYATVDFGSGGSVSNAFAAMRTVSPHGPLVNSEFYPGWLTHWGEKIATVDSDAVVKTLRTMLEMKANVNFYMFYGGTNFGFSAGANAGAVDTFGADLTSYDYDAPLTEAGDATKKYFAIRDVVLEYLPHPPLPPPKPSPKADYGKLTVYPVASIFDPITQVVPPLQSPIPLSFEALDQAFGFVLYETIIPEGSELLDPAFLQVPGLRDRAQVFIDEKLVVTLYRNKLTSAPLSIRANQKLSLLVENMGRINYGKLLHDPKGILSDVLLDSRPISPWSITQFPLSNLSWVESATTTNVTQTPLFYTATFTLNKEHPKPLDGYIDMNNWSKGVVFINEHNLGRYWSTMGPQLTLYLPAPYIKPYPEVNRLTIFELQRAPSDLVVNFVTSPIFRARAFASKTWNIQNPN
uniref:Beta-galactosidase n=1 Tax=Cacopsylla melanoneura TaxID=428564 RepID=A0A8D8LJF2_9HEMI